MMKKALFVIVAIAAVASTAMAVPTLQVLGVYGTGTETQGRAMTPDGKYIVGYSAGTGGVLWDVANPSTPISVGASSATGVGYRNNDSQLVIHGLSAGWNAELYYNIGSNTFDPMRRDVGVSTSPKLGATGTLRTVGGASDLFYETWYSKAGEPMYVGKGTGSPATIARDEKGTGAATEGNMQSVSYTGLAVGRRRASGIWQNSYCQWNGSGTPANGNFAGLDGTTKGEAWSVSGNGQYVFGYSPKTAVLGNYAYMKTWGTSTIVELPNLGGPSLGTSATTWGIPYFASDDGRYVVGLDYTFGYEKAVLWDTQAMSILDLSVFAANNGILGTFINGSAGNGLRRAYGVGVNGEGNVVISGYGYSSSLSGWTGYVLTLPEPTTVIFLALGSVALLRRRH